MPKIRVLFTSLLLAACALAVQAQPPSPAPLPPDPNAAKAQKLLDEMVQALGGERWLNQQNRYTEGSIAAFYKGKPTLGTTPFWAWTTPTVERIDLTEKKHDQQNWVQLFTDNQCWEITYRGKRAMNPKLCRAYVRDRDHSIEAAVKIWMKNPKTLLMYDGQRLVERHLADKISLLNDRNDAVEIDLDVQTHLPLRRSWQWHDSVYHDIDTAVEEYDDYHAVDGIATPFTITHFENGEMTGQRFITNALYNVPVPPDWYNLAAIIARAKH